MYRGRFLEVLGTGVGAAASGCHGLTGTRREPYLEAVTVRNLDTADHEFGLAVERAGSVVHEETIELAGSGTDQSQTSVACDWSGRGPFVVTCTLNDGETERVRVDRSSDDIDQGQGAYAQVTFTTTDTGALGSSGYLDDGGREC
ncbi:hypothetical protein BRC64_12545 [Halobacteriales archaeon QH_10_67_22]|nr:MAG: hypothetical protein BRC64_12545 [Halobacteriales archaeon QH_10_67_22]